MNKITLIVGARPNFMKSAPLIRELRKYPDIFETSLVHTGQHYDHKMSQLFFEDLKMPEPDIYLGIGSGTHAEQTGRIMMALEKILIDTKPNLIVVFGDVNSTLAAAVVAAKLWIKVAHIEAGMRSFDNRMPEEINRIVADRLSDYLFVPEDSGWQNLINEGYPEDRIYRVGNIMIDSLVNNLPVAEKSGILDELNLEPEKYAVLTLHRPANVDNDKILSRLMSTMADISREIPVVFPCHPRTASRLKKLSISENSRSNLKIIEPLGYLDFLKLQSQAKLVMTDSGGIQGETSYLGIPCLTLREVTEWPVTLEQGTNVLTGTDPEKIGKAVRNILENPGREYRHPDLWDGRSAERIVKVLKEVLG